MIDRRAILAVAVSPRAVSAKPKMVIKAARQPSIIYMPTYIIKTGKLIEAHAKRLGLPSLSVDWVTFQ